MAGDWIKVENVTPDKPEIFAMADYLKIDPDAVVGKLLRIWIWADQHTEDGNARSVTKALLDRLSGEPHFGDAMEHAGWLIDTEDGIEIPNFDRHNGQSCKRRALTAKRKAKHKAKSNAEGNAEVTLGALPREEKRRGTTPLNPPKGGERRKRKWEDADAAFERVRKATQNYNRYSEAEEREQAKSGLTKRELFVLAEMKATKFWDTPTADLNKLKGDFRQVWQSWEES